MEINADLFYDHLVESTTQKLSFNKDVHFDSWKEELNNKFIELTGLDSIKENECPYSFEIVERKEKDGYTQIRYIIESEKNNFVPVYILIPKGSNKKYPVAITLQGHSSGFHNSIAEPKDEKENEYALGRGCFAVQAVKHGYVAVAIEQRSMGETKTKVDERWKPSSCDFFALTSFLMGRTLIADRIWDVSKVIDSLKEFEVCDLSKIFITGNSGGGTISYYSACFDKRIKMTVPSCAFCTYGKSILNVSHCSCNYIPFAYKFFDMPDLAGLIAPTKMIIVAGKDDKIFQIDGVIDGYKKVKEIYKKVNAEENCKLVVTEKGHYWCQDIVWDEIDKAIKTI